MRAEDIREHTRQQPFQPFILHLSDGTGHLVRHPEMILVAQRQVVIAEPSEPDRVPRRLVMIDPMHVTHITADASPEPQSK